MVNAAAVGSLSWMASAAAAQTGCFFSRKESGALNAPIALNPVAAVDCNERSLGGGQTSQCSQWARMLVVSPASPSHIYLFSALLSETDAYLVKQAFPPLL
jgi:hypothetical protein